MNPNPKQEPIIVNGITAKIGTLERRIEHLERRLENRSPDYGNSASADFDRAEVSALKAAVKCMTAHAGAAHARGVVYWRGSTSDVVTDLRALLTPEEMRRLKDAI